MNAAALLIGGIVPAAFLGLGTVLMRASMGAGATIPSYLAAVGTTIAVAGWASVLWTDGVAISLKAHLYAAAMGLTWCVAITCIAYGFGTLKMPVSVIAPLTNSNALVAVLVGALMFAEWKQLNMISVAFGTVLICIGATIVSLSR